MVLRGPYILGITMFKPSDLNKVAEVYEGIPVWGCLPGYSADSAGIRAGDIVIRVNGMATPTIDEYLEARALDSRGADITYVREGKEHTVRLAFGQSRPDVAEAARQVVEHRMMPTRRSGREPPDDN